MLHYFHPALLGSMIQHSRRVGIVALPLFCAATAGFVDLPFAITFGTIGSLIALIATEPKRAHPITGRQLWRTNSYFQATIDLMVDACDTAPCILFCLSIDDFKPWCKKNGTAAKSRVIEAVYDRLANVVRHDDVVMHMSDDHFFIALTMRGVFDVNTTLSIATRLQRAIDPAITIDDRSHYFSVSIGIADTQMTGIATSKALCTAAVSANQSAKDQGDGQIRFFSHCLAKVKTLSPRPTAPHVHNALQAGEIHAFFQPQVCGFTGQIIGFEALARWTKPDGTIVPPNKFLDVLASSGQMPALTDAMITQSLRSWKTWGKKGHSIDTVSVNLSKDDLNDPKLVDRIRWHLTQADVAPRHLTLEVVEDVVVTSENAVAAQNIKGLVKLGCRIDLDDFGTGTASIPSLRHLTLHRIKIDRSFVTHCDHDPRQQRLMVAMIAMAHELGLQVVAEGIETIAEQCEAIRQGVDAIQGYAIAKPMPAGAVPSWIENYHHAQHRAPKSAAF